MVTRVCLDTNIFISAFIFSGKPAQVFDLAVNKKIILVSSPAILAEVAKVLRNKFNWEEQNIKKQLKVLQNIATIVVPKTTVRKLMYKPDNQVLEAALAGEADDIVTGDKKHLLPLKEFRGILIMTPAQFLTAIHNRITS